METGIQVVWWIGLVGALLATYVVLQQVFSILRTLRNIHRLAELVREAAQGIATNAAAGSRLRALEEPARALRQSAGTLASAATSLERNLYALPADRRLDGG